MRRLLLACLAVLAITATAADDERFEGHVTHVSDGDTIWVRPERGGAPLAVRLEGIDAPELCQPHGLQARDALARRVLRQPVSVQATGRDDYGRLLARVHAGGSDVGARLVRQGHAWSYRFRRDRGPYAKEERAARQARRGLWADPSPMEPRAFRRQHGPCA
ncbi:MAG: thermonuclease family protein [Burkholderiales bacterium]|nr:thermonuclease family protein [Burkholderiales bacterium]